MLGTGFGLGGPPKKPARPDNKRLEQLHAAKNDHDGDREAVSDTPEQQRLMAAVGRLLGKGHSLWYALRCVADENPGMTVADLKRTLAPKPC